MSGGSGSRVLPGEGIAIDQHPRLGPGLVVIRSGPHEPEADVFPLRERLRFRDNLGLGLRDVRRRPAFAALERGPWLVFIAIACYWQSNAEAWPSQETIAGFTGYSSRAVRDYLEALERSGIVRLRRERRASGSERIYYAPGPVTLTELAAFVERFPSNYPKATPAHPPEASSATPPETSSMEPRDQDLELFYSCTSGGPAPSPVPVEQEQPRVTKEDREIARGALAERMKRKHPKRPPPRWFDRVDVEMVAECTAAIEGDRDVKLRAHREAIDGAFGTSRDGPPTSRFIWGKLEHFLEHLDRGGRKARAQEREAQRHDAQGLQTASARRGGVGGIGGPARLSPPSREDLAKTRAEFEQLAASAAPQFRGYLESMVARYRELERMAG